MKYEGKPCRTCDGTLRYVSSKKCVKCYKEFRQRYNRENPQKTREYLRRYREKNREKIRERSRIYREKNREKIREINRRYRKNNNERIWARRRYYREANIALIMWRSAKIRTRKHDRQFTITVEDVDAALHCTNGVCPALHIPLFVGKGKITDNSPTLDRIDSSKGYTPDNIQVISWRANRLKNNANFKDMRKLSSHMERRLEAIAARVAGKPVDNDSAEV